ncbi:MAG: methyltransferase domain-containing protein [Gammaproteobacteria bacterium]|nr:MAG: methyltransferase domain-containing protein [Gammaproteobacteria bacterium]
MVKKNRKSGPDAVRHCYSLDLLQCPACHRGRLDEAGLSLLCDACGREFPVRDGIPVLLRDAGVSTRLDLMDYDAHHNIDELRREKVSEDWEAVFEEHDIAYGDVLEIGAGTGQFTWGLVVDMPFKSVHACDISYPFLDGLEKELAKEQGAPRYYYQCDANNLPFTSCSFDLVVGHSVLHHFLNYETTLANIRRLLRPGGRAMFYEPVIQGKILIAFFGELIIRTEKNTGIGIMDEQDIKNIQAMIRHITKSRWLGEDKSKLAKMEDKYIFDIVKMEELAKELGYSGFEFYNNGKPHWGYKWHVQQHLLMAGIKPEKVQKYTYLFNAFGHSVSDLTPSSLVTPMGYFVFKA